MACRINFETFSDPFIVADVDHEMNTLQVVRTNDRYAPLEVLSSELVDTGDRDDDGNTIYHASNIYYTAIPNIRCATATGCTSPLPLVAPGGTISFHVTVRNDGNCYLAGCTLQLCLHENRVTDEDGNVQSEDVSEVKDCSAEVTFSQETLVVSCWNPMEAGEIQNVEPDWSLAPGKRGVYKVDITIPKEWGADGEDEKLVSFVARKPVMAKGGGLVAQSEGDDEEVFQDFSIEPGTYKPYREQMTPDTDRDQTHMQVIQVCEAVAEGADTADAPVTYATDGERAEPAPYVPGATVPQDPSTSDTRSTPQDPATYDRGNRDLGVNALGYGIFGPLGSNGSFGRRSGVRRPSAESGTSNSGSSSNTSSGQNSQGAQVSQGAQGATGAAAATGLASGAPGTAVTGGAAASGNAGAAGSQTSDATGAANTAQGSTQGAERSSVEATDTRAVAVATPGTADETFAALPVAAVLAGAAAVAAGTYLKDKGDKHSPDHE